VLERSEELQPPALSPPVLQSHTPIQPTVWGRVGRRARNLFSLLSNTDPTTPEWSCRTEGSRGAGEDCVRLGGVAERGEELEPPALRDALAAGRVVGEVRDGGGGVFLQESQ
jgi:hypothetical protein